MCSWAFRAQLQVVVGVDAQLVVQHHRRLPRHLATRPLPLTRPDFIRGRSPLRLFFCLRLLLRLHNGDGRKLVLPRLHDVGRVHRAHDHHLAVPRFEHVVHRGLRFAKQRRAVPQNDGRVEPHAGAHVNRDGVGLLHEQDLCLLELVQQPPPCRGEQRPLLRLVVHHLVQSLFVRPCRQLVKREGPLAPNRDEAARAQRQAVQVPQRVRAARLRQRRAVDHHHRPGRKRLHRVARCSSDELARLFAGHSFLLRSRWRPQGDGRVPHLHADPVEHEVVFFGPAAAPHHELPRAVLRSEHGHGHGMAQHLVLVQAAQERVALRRPAALSKHIVPRHALP
mmetsp:Transcript_74664/g.145996  ORF Transcript_74664/g.145996 Transcript_74664/m.145996 type:complete len:337 (+) Transcript_74664:1260-2270(+)